MWALISNDQIQEVTAEDPEGRYHSDIEFFQIPEYMEKYVTLQYVFADGTLLPYSKEQLHNQFITNLNLKAMQLLSIGIVYGKSKYDSSIISALTPALLADFSTYLIQNRFGFIETLDREDYVKIYHGMVVYQQNVFKRIKELTTELNSLPYLNGEETALGLKASISQFEQMLETGWPNREIKENNNELS